MSKSKNRRNQINLEDKRLKNKGIKTKSDQAKEPKPAKQNSKEALRVMALGGLGEIGKNLYVFEYEEDIIIVDMGFKFPDDEMLGIDYIIPDIAYLEERKEKIKGILITHGHEDHIGGIPYLLPKIGAPIFATKLTIGLIEGKLSEFTLAQGAGLHIIDPEKDKLKLGQFDIEWFRVSHSIPDAVGISIKTPLGRVLTTGDFKFDFSPVDDKNVEISKLARWGDEGILLLLSDSTGAEVPGYTMSEKGLHDSFDRIFDNAEGRIIIASFSSQLNRIQMVIDAAKSHGRKLAFSGRSLLKNTEIAVRLGYLKIPADLIVKIEDIPRLPDNKVCVMSTGSQGEAMSALSRMASGDHRNIKIKKGDTVVFSSSPIPGNEVSVTHVMDDLFRLGADVIFDEKNGDRTHVSGHPGQEELKLMLNMTRPKYFMPMHGERHHLVHHKELAINVGIPEENIFVMDNGEVLEIKREGAKMAETKVPNGIILIDGLGIGDVGEIVLRDRKAMSTEGVFVVICTVDRKTGKLATSPDIISRGFIYMRENEKLVNDTRNEVKKVIEMTGNHPQNWANVKVKLKDRVQDYLYRNTQRKPMVIPVIIEI
ncbi:MAG: ribonuclease J [Patescibacteria group bacterium]|nr:ribonuclease J [Patescibacteria group bacterium]